MNLLDNARPMRFGEILDFTFRIFRKGFKVLFLLTLLLWGFFLFIQELIDVQTTFPHEMDDFDPKLLLFFLGGLVLLLLGYIFVKPILDIAITNITLKQFGNQQTGSVREALQSIKSNIGKAIGTNFILHLFLSIGGTLVLIGILFLLISIGEIGVDLEVDFDKDPLALLSVVFLTFFIIILFLIPFIYFYTRFSLYFPIIAAENIGYLQALGRSWELTRSAFWRIFGLYLLLGLLITVFYYAIGFVVAIPTFILLVTKIPGAFIFSIILAIFAAIAMCIPYSLEPIITTLIYIDRRAVREGEDMKAKLSEWQKEVDGQSGGELPGNDRV